MASVNPLSRELVFKIVYYGPGLGGKTTTLEYLHATAKPEHRGKLVSLATPVDRTLYFDFLPVRLPAVRGMNIRLQLFTVPGQVYFNATRKLVLTGADGLVFVSDSQAARADSNLESLENLRENLAEQGRSLTELPLVFQHNKRDLPEVLPIEELDAMLNPFDAPSVPASATTGLGIYDALEQVSSRVMRSFAARMPGVAGTSISFAAAEGGLEAALRDASADAATRGSGAVVTRLPAPAVAWPAMPPNTTLDATPGRTPDATPEVAATKAGEPAEGNGASAPAARAEPEPARDAASLPGLSFAELWPEGERETVRQVEAAIATRRHAQAIALCETLVSRALASAAGLFGSTEAPRDPVLVPMLLGLDGRRYLAFRAQVRDARTGALLDAADALSVYSFAIDARLARNAIG
jgi:mutual gliding-motility protein MglA